MDAPHSKTSVIVLIILIGILIVLGLYFGVRQFGLIGKNTDFVTVSTVKTSTESSSSGEVHSIEARFSIETARNKSTGIDQKALHERISDVVSKLDYDVISAVDGTKYIKNEIANNISEFVNPEDLIAVYITDVISDAELEEDTLPDRRTDVFRGLFENVK